MCRPVLPVLMGEVVRYARSFVRAGSRSLLMCVIDRSDQNSPITAP